ncbi:MAG: TIGR00300 family protein [Candidatus Humimicrobiia bacterium]
MENKNAIELIEIKGHIIDSLILPQIFDEIVEAGGEFEVVEFVIGKTNIDESLAKIKISAISHEVLDIILYRLQRLGVVPVKVKNASTAPAPKDGILPDDFYSTTNIATKIRISRNWIDVQNQEMDCAVVINKNQIPECVRMSKVKKGDHIVIGRNGIRVMPTERPREGTFFEFMTSSVSSEKPKRLLIKEIAKRMRLIKESDGKILFVCGPAVVHTGAKKYLVRLINNGYIDVLFSGNALAVHDLESEIFGTSLGISLKSGAVTDEGHGNHLRAINIIKNYGSIKNAIDAGVIKDGIMHALIKNKKEYVLAGSIRDDGPLPEVITDVVEAQDAMRSKLKDIKMALMLATMLHSIAVGNLLPATVETYCIDINPAVVTKLTDRGSFQTRGMVTDIGLFLRDLTNELINVW